MVCLFILCKLRRKPKYYLYNQKNPKNQTQLGLSWCALLWCRLVLQKHSKILNPCVFAWLLLQQI